MSTVVFIRSNSRNSSSTSLETDTGASRASVRAAAAARTSFSGFAYACRKQIATASHPASHTSRTTRRTSAGSTGCSISPVASVRS